MAGPRAFGLKPDVQLLLWRRGDGVWPTIRDERYAALPMGAPAANPQNDHSRSHALMGSLACLSPQASIPVWSAADEP
jgi:hypothetical protein